MKSEVYDDMALEENIKKHFAVQYEIDQVIARNIPVGRTSNATVFITEKKELFAYISAESRLTLGDVRKMVSRMGLVAERFLPPHGNAEYFDEIARDKFLAVFPGRSHLRDDDLAYYRTLAPYRPALVQIARVKDGEIRQFDTDSSSGWRLAARFVYRRIKTS